MALFAAGKRAKGVCQRCGLTWRNNDLIRERQTGLRVCRGCLDEDTSRPRRIPVDAQALRDVSPEFLRHDAPLRVVDVFRTTALGERVALRAAEVAQNHIGPPSVVAPDHGRVDVDPVLGDMTYAPDAEFAGADVFAYTFRAPDGTRAQGVCTVAVVDVRPVPTARDVNLTVSAAVGGAEPYVPAAFDARDYVDDPAFPFEALTFAFERFPNGQLDDLGDGRFSYTPDAGFDGQDGGVIVVSNPVGRSVNLRVVVLVVAPVPPFGVRDDEANVHPRGVTLLRPLDNDDAALRVVAVGIGWDVAGDVLARSWDDGKLWRSAFGVASVVEDGQAIRYAHAAGGHGRDDVFYAVIEGGDAEAPEYRISRVAVAIDDGTTPAATFAATVTADAGLTLPLDAGAAVASVGPLWGATSAVFGWPGGPSHTDANGVLTPTPSGEGVAFAPAANAPGGVASYTALLRRPDGSTFLVRLDFTVTALPNAAPTAAGASREVEAGTSATVDVVALASDPDDDPLRVAAIARAPTNGTAAISADRRSIAYTPATTFTGADRLTFEIDDGRGGKDTADLTYSVIPPQRPWSPRDLKGRFLWLDAKEGRFLTSGSGVATDGARVATWTKTEAADPDAAQADAAKRPVLGTAADGVKHVTGEGGHLEAAGALGDPEMVLLVADPGAADGRSRGFLGAESADKGDALNFRFSDVGKWRCSRVYDGGGYFEQEIASRPGRQIVILRRRGLTSGRAEVWRSGEVARVTLPNGANQAFKPTSGRWTIGADLIGPNVNTTAGSGRVSCVLASKDQVLDADFRKLTLWAQEAYFPSVPKPTAGTFTLFAKAGDTLTIDALAGGSAPGGGPLKLCAIDDFPDDNDAIGTLTADPAKGTIVWALKTTATDGPRDAWFAVQDTATGMVAWGRVALTISAVPQNRLSTRPDTFSVPNNQTLARLDVLANDLDPLAQGLTLVSVAGGSGLSGVFRVAADKRAVEFAPKPGYEGQEAALYVARDGAGNEAAGQLIVTVTAANPNLELPPVAEDDFYTVPAGRLVRLPVLENDRDPNGGLLTLDSVTAPALGTAAEQARTFVTYQAPATAGAGSFGYVTSKADGQTRTAAVRVTVSTGRGSPHADGANFSDSTGWLD